jgi:hypothetical protein
MDDKIHLPDQIAQPAILFPRHLELIGERNEVTTPRQILCVLRNQFCPVPFRLEFGDQAVRQSALSRAGTSQRVDDNGAKHWVLRR